MVSKKELTQVSEKTVLPNDIKKTIEETNARQREPN